MEDMRSKAMEEKAQAHQGRGKHQGRTGQGEQQAPTRVAEVCIAMPKMNMRGSGQEQCRHPTNHRPMRLSSTT